MRTAKPQFSLRIVKLCIMLSHASKGHNLILMISYICSYLKLYYDVISVMLLSDDVTYQFCVILVLSINISYWH